MASHAATKACLNLLQSIWECPSRYSSGKGSIKAFLSIFQTSSIGFNHLNPMRFKPLLHMLCCMNSSIILLKDYSRFIHWLEAILKTFQIGISCKSSSRSILIPLYNDQLWVPTKPDRTQSPRSFVQYPSHDSPGSQDHSYTSHWRSTRQIRYDDWAFFGQSIHQKR